MCGGILSLPCLRLGELSNMSSIISRAGVILLALTLLSGGVAAQDKKKKRTKASKTAASKTATSKSTPAKTPPVQVNTGDPIPPPQPPEQGDGVRRITPAEAREALDKGQAIIIDVRNDEAYKMGHVKGALLIPVNDFVARMKDLPRDKLIITYCS